MRKFHVKIDSDIFGYHEVIIEAERMGTSEAGDLLFYTDDKGINRIAYTIAEGFWHSCSEIDKDGKNILKVEFIAPVDEVNADAGE